MFLLVCFGCGDESSNEDEIVQDSVEDEIVVETDPKKDIVWKKDGKEMTLIPAGSFEMGDHFSEGEKDELPVHKVNLDAFYMDTHEVTVGQFKQFINQTGYDWSPPVGDMWDAVARLSPGDDYPMVYVNWNDATAYAEWAGKRLPTEAEWEYAARGGVVGQRYPSGDDITRNDANYKGAGGRDKWDTTTALVGSFEANGYGLHDMVGNVWEWCQDWYDENYYSNSPANNPPGPETGSDRVSRGGGWAYDSDYLRLADRYNYPNDRYSTYGFRCVSGSIHRTGFFLQH